MDQSSQLDVTFEAGNLSDIQLQAELDSVIAELLSTPEGRAEIESSGISPDDLTDTTFTVEQASSGVVETAVIIHILGGLAIRVGYDLGKAFLLKVVIPKIKAKMGRDAVGDEKK